MRESNELNQLRNWATNPRNRKAVAFRSTLIQAIRNHMLKHGFIEVDTPTIVTHAAFVRHKEADMDSGMNEIPSAMQNSGVFGVSSDGDESRSRYLRTSPEAYLKRYIVGGFERIFSICSAFRSDSIDAQHVAEFKMIEWEEVGSDCLLQIDRVEVLIREVAQQCLGQAYFCHGIHTIDLTKPWRRMTVLEALSVHAGIQAQTMSLDDIRNIAAKHEIPNAEELTWGLCVVMLFEELVVPQLIEPVFITEHPREICPLALPLETDHRLSDRFEPYVCGMELGNAYANQTNGELIYKQCVETSVSAGFSEDEIEIDNELLSAIRMGFPPSAGCALGIERLAMLFLNMADIRSVVPFPQ